MNDQRTRRFCFLLSTSFLLFTLLPLLPPPSLLAAVPTAEKDALIALYNSTNGASWTNNAGWTDHATTDPCDDGWYGITCNGGGTNATQLNLNNNNLTGPLPASIGDISTANPELDYQPDQRLYPN